jgi:lysophospholipase L1-like esterase
MADRPRIMLLGDSIRMSYQPIVAAMLADRADVVGPAENGQFSLYTLKRLGFWVDQFGVPDIVHWNNGIHDVGHCEQRGPRQFSLDDYLANLGFILEGLKTLGAGRVIFAITTPVRDGADWSGRGWSWSNEEIDAYNAAARTFMESRSVPINDLNAVVRSDPDRLLSEDNLHLSDAGKQACAEKVVKALEAYLPS